MVYVVANARRDGCDGPYLDEQWRQPKPLMLPSSLRPFTLTFKWPLDREEEERHDQLSDCLDESDWTTSL